MKKEIEIKVKANHQNRTFTIRKYENGKVYVKFRTCRQSKKDFEDMQNNTEGDWKNYLSTSGDYYEVKN